MATSEENISQYVELMPGLPDDVALSILARISHGYHGRLECVCKKWRDAIRSAEYSRIKAAGGWCGNWIFICTNNGRRWEAYDTKADTWYPLPTMPTIKSDPPNGLVGFSCVTVCKRLLVIGGRTVSFHTHQIISDVSVFDPFKKEWYVAAKMIKARQNFACATISGKVYVTGGRDSDGWCCDAEVYDACTGRWDHLPEMPFSLEIRFSMSRGEQLYVIGKKVTDTEYTHIVFNTVDCKWEVLDNTTPYIWFNDSSVTDHTLYVLDEETIEASPAAIRETNISSWPAQFLPECWRQWRRYGGNCLVGSKGRIYFIGVRVDLEIGPVVKLNLTHTCDVTGLPLKCESLSLMLFDGGRIVGCAVLTE